MPGILPRCLLVTGFVIYILSELLRVHEEATSNQIVVVTFPSLEGENLEEFTHRLAETWGIFSYLLAVACGFVLCVLYMKYIACRFSDQPLSSTARQGVLFGAGVTAVIPIAVNLAFRFEFDHYWLEFLGWNGFTAWVLFAFGIGIAYSAWSKAQQRFTLSAWKSSWSRIGSGGFSSYDGGSSWTSSDYSGGFSSGGGSFGGAGASGSW